MVIEPIAKIHNGHNDKFGIPRQGGIASEDISYIVFEEKYRTPEALRGLEGYSHIWLLWGFTDTGAKREFSPTVRPPRLGGNIRVGVFATRSPNRPNSIGMSCVRLDSVIHTEKYGQVLCVYGADMMNMTEIYDIKPYVPHFDAISDAKGGFADDFSDYSLKIGEGEEKLSVISDERDRATVRTLLCSDPRPSYQRDSSRIYTMDHYKYKVSFSVDGECVHVHSIDINDMGGDEVYEYMRMRGR